MYRLGYDPRASRLGLEDDLSIRLNQVLGNSLALGQGEKPTPVDTGMQYGPFLPGTEPPGYYGQPEGTTVDPSFIGPLLPGYSQLPPGPIPQRPMQRPQTPPTGPLGISWTWWFIGGTVVVLGGLGLLAWQRRR
jgi:hypothetical protein